MDVVVNVILNNYKKIDDLSKIMIMMHLRMNLVQVQKYSKNK